MQDRVPNPARRLNRRTFLVASTAACAGVRFGDVALSAPSGGGARHSNSAKSTILFFLCGGASHIDTWDMKPTAPAEYRGPFRPIRTTSPEILLCEHLPQLARQARHLSVVQGVTDRGQATGDHHAGYYYNLTGRVPDQTFRTQGNDRRPYPDDWPFIGSVIGSRRAAHPSLPQVITLPHKPSRPPYTRPGQFAARLGAEFDPLYLQADPANALSFIAPTLVLDAGVTGKRFDDRRSLLNTLDAARQVFDSDPAVDRLSRQHQKAFDLLTSASATNAFDVAQEPESVRQRYGDTINGLSLLMARRLVEAGVPFVTVFWKENEQLKDKCRSAGGWDTHGNNFNCLKDHLLPEFDRGFSALIEDLHQRRLLDDTLLVVNSEMGRKPKIGDPRSGGTTGAGRDHWTTCMSVLFAGGGVRGGQVVGQSDDRAEYPAGHPFGPEDIARTVYHAMGVDKLDVTNLPGQPLDLLGDGTPITQLF